mmetsp:Transcript_6139/g.15255  ORF Transcript_6139/g.15255 Transcript_6139/m.15255 type:complete len:222 (-) Transcript_6139:988-1653(-)
MDVSYYYLFVSSEDGTSPSSSSSLLPLSSFFSCVVPPKRGFAVTAEACPPNGCDDGAGDANALNIVILGVVAAPGVGRVMEEPEVPNENCGRPEPMLLPGGLMSKKAALPKPDAGADPASAFLLLLVPNNPVPPDPNAEPFPNVAEVPLPNAPTAVPFPNPLPKVDCEDDAPPPKMLAVDGPVPLTVGVSALGGCLVLVTSSPSSISPSSAATSGALSLPS